MYKLGILVLALTMFLVACEDPSKGKPKAKVSETTENTEKKEEVKKDTGDETKKETEGKGLAVNPETSKIEFTGSKVTGKHDGGFKKFNGNIELVNDKVEESKVSVEIDMVSVFSDADGLTKHLKTGDFFEVEKFPKSSFKSTKIVADEAKGKDNYTVTGDLELRGQKKSIEFPAKITISDSDVNVDAEFSINRKDFGIVYAGKADDLIRDNVVIRLDLKSSRK